MAITPEIFGAAIVALGSFNPPIFSPDWLSQHNLIGSGDAEGAKASKELLISKPFVHIDTEVFDLQVVENRLTLSSKDALSPVIKDMAIGMLSLLPHTPITAVGLNFMAHYRIDNEADYHRIGDTLAPKDIWRSLYPGENDSAGMVDVTIVIHPFKRGETPTTQDKKQITVQPSARVKQGVFFSLNDHHEISAISDKTLTQAETAAKIIADYWQSDWEESVRVFEGVLERTLSEKN